MDPTHFDAVTRLVGRRGIVRGLLGFAALAGATVILPHPATALTFCIDRPKNAPCKKNGQCCSGRCKKRKGRRKGKCRCGGFQAECSVDTDCCGHDPSDSHSPECSFNGASTVAVCCSPLNAPCGGWDDCCGDGFCLGGLCSLP
jgi:hypothetical protein